jgi:hypothetical protein
MSKTEAGSITVRMSAAQESDASLPVCPPNMRVTVKTHSITNARSALRGKSMNARYRRVTSRGATVLPTDLSEKTSPSSIDIAANTSER